MSPPVYGGAMRIQPSHRCMLAVTQLVFQCTATTCVVLAYIWASVELLAWEPDKYLVVVDVQHANSNSVISMRFLNQEECTILISKNNNKYRLQGTSYTALLLPLTELMRRLKAHYESATGAGISMQLEEGVPVQWLLKCIDQHFGLRRQRQHVTAELEHAAAQV